MLRLDRRPGSTVVIWLLTYVPKKRPTPHLDLLGAHSWAAVRHALCNFHHSTVTPPHPSPPTEPGKTSIRAVPLAFSFSVMAPEQEGGRQCTLLLSAPRSSLTMHSAQCSSLTKITLASLSFQKSTKKCMCAELFLSRKRVFCNSYRLRNIIWIKWRLK
jgi:hypothetical protein